MEPIPKSGLFYPNYLTRIALFALEDVMGTNGLNTILNLAGQSQLIGNYPPEDMDMGFDISYFSAIFGAMDELYGPKGGRILAMRAGGATFKQMIVDIGDAVDVNDEDFQTLPLTDKIQAGLSLVKITFSQSTIIVPSSPGDDEHFQYSLQYCPVCWGRTTDTPACFLIAGLLRASLRWVTSGQEFNVTQNAAKSCGAPTCDFIIPKTPIS